VSDEEIFLLVAALSQCHGRIVHDPRSAVDLDQVFRSPRDIVHRLLGPKPESADAATPLGPRGYLMIVDDEPLLRSALRRVLGGQHATTCPKTFADALALVAGGMRFDLILCDLVAPGRAGAAFYDEILRQDPDQARRIIFLTDATVLPATVRFLSSVPNRRIGKPCDMQLLRALVNQLLVETGPAGPSCQAGRFPEPRERPMTNQTGK
ncbi:MAG TPA: response regulator, partial [Polyangia bacterium]|nr:response regulator [Polyangia bacterium]